MNSPFFLHVNNHKNYTLGRKKKPSFTVVALREGNTLIFGGAKCSKNDNFCKKIGRELALKNAQEEGHPVEIPEYVLNTNKIGGYFVKKAHRLVRQALSVLILLIGMSAGAQTYVNGSFSYYNGAGSFGQQGMVTVEVGRVVKNELTVGLATGVTSFTGGNLYSELRPTLYHISGPVSFGATIGAGYVYNSETPFLTEFTGSINYNFGAHWGVGVSMGVFNFNGRNASADYTYFGTGLTYIFSKNGNR